MFGVVPDLTVLGKAIGAGMPISAVTGTRAVMEALVDGRVMHRGTFNGNPLSVSAAIACVEKLQRDAARIYPRMNAQAAAIQAHINAQAAALDLDVCANNVGSAVQIFTGVRQMARIGDLAGADRGRIVKLTEMLLLNGLMPLPRGLMYLSAAHTDEDIKKTMHALSEGLQAYAAL